jgi:hypothetical protein
LWREANRLVHWTSETWWESCEIAGSPQIFQMKNRSKRAVRKKSFKKWIFQMENRSKRAVRKKNKKMRKHVRN